MIALALAAALATTPLAPLPKWASQLVAEDWDPLLGVTDLIVFTRPARGSAVSEFVRLWVRRENKLRTPLSVAELYEFDCKGGRVRILNSTGFAQHNLRGKSQALRTETSVWVNPIPDTVGGSLLEKACP